MEQGVTRTSEDEESRPILIVSRFEQINQNIDTTTSYRLSRLFGLEPEMKSFLFKMLQSLLPTKERLHRIGKVLSSSCIFCPGEEDTLEHLVSCHYSSEVTTPLLLCLQSQDNSITPGKITTLNIKTSEAMELPLTWLIST